MPSLDVLNGLSQHTLMEHLDIRIEEVGDDYIKSSMPVDHRTHQPAGLLHGGASVALSESIGSIAGVLTVDDIATETVVGVEISAHHLRSVKEGRVYAITKPIKIGKKLQVWETNIFDENDHHICVSKLTTITVSRDSKGSVRS